MKLFDGKLTRYDTLIDSDYLGIEMLKNRFDYDVRSLLDADRFELFKNLPLINKDFMKYLSNYEVIQETRYINPAYVEKQQIEIAGDYHVIVCVHGLGGSSWDLIQIKNSISTLYPDCAVYCVTSTENMSLSLLKRVYR